MTFKEWIIATLGPQGSDDGTGHLDDLATLGATNGFAGITMYSDTTKLYNEYESELWEMLKHIAQEMGYPSVLNLLVTTVSGYDIETHWQFKNLVIWICAEKIAADYCDNRGPRPW